MNDSRPIRVLHIIDGLGGGGCERWLWDIVRVSDPELFEHYVVTTHPDTGSYVYGNGLRERGVYRQPASPRMLSFFWKNSQEGTSLKRQTMQMPLRLLWRLGSYGMTAMELPRALVKFQPDVVHAHTYYASFVTGLMAKAIAGVPLVYTVPAHLSQMKDTSLRRMPALYARYHRWVDRFLTGVLSQELLSLGIPASKVATIKVGVDLKAIEAVRSDRDIHRANIRRSLNLPEDTNIALSVGRLHSSKGHLYALESLPAVLQQIPNLHWIVLGEGPQRGELETRARELGVAENIHLVGFKAEPLPYYASADIYLRTPVLEADNLSSAQAVAMGLPIVGFDTGAESEVVANADNGILVSNRDPAAFGQAVASILMSTDRGRAMGERGAEYGRRHLDIEHAASPFFAAYMALGKVVGPA